MFWPSTSDHATKIVRWSVWTRRQNNCLPTRVPIPMKPGQPERRDYEYERNGTANLFMMFAPLEGWRRVKVTDRRTAIDYARALEDLSDRVQGYARCSLVAQGRRKVDDTAVS